MAQNQLKQYLSFVIDHEHYALAVQSVREVLEFRDVTKIPGMPSYMIGVINIRGAVVPVVDLRKKFNLPEIEQTVNTNIIVVEFQNEEQLELIGLRTDMVEAVLDIPDKDMKPSPKLGTQIENSMIQGMAHLEEHFLIILNLNKLLLKEEIEILTQETLVH